MGVKSVVLTIYQHLLLQVCIVSVVYIVCLEEWVILRRIFLVHNLRKMMGFFFYKTREILWLLLSLIGPRLILDLLTNNVIECRVPGHPQEIVTRG